MVPLLRMKLGLTVPGAAVLVIALAVLFRSLAARNAYEIVLSTATLGLWLVVGGTGLWGARRLKTLEPGWNPPLPLGANTEEETVVTGLAQRAPWFFRLHFILRGRFYPQGGSEGCPVRAEVSVPRGAGTARLPLSFPLGGVFRGEGSCRLRDLFGFFSFECGLPQHRALMVRNAPCIRKNFRIDAQSGAEDRRHRNTSDEERYYMREYAPGDRLRDINWKSSERIDTLITRISPDNQEKVSRIEVYFRNYGPLAIGQRGSRESPFRGPLESLWLLDRAKARLAQFLRSVKESEAAYVFVVRTAQAVQEIRDQDELEAFLEELAGLPFSPPRNETAPGPESSPGARGELYLFSTACDTALPAFLLSCQGRPVSLYLVQPPLPGKKGEQLRLRDFPAKGLIPSPRWFFPGKERPLSLPAGKVEIDYAEVRW